MLLPAITDPSFGRNQRKDSPSWRRDLLLSRGNGPCAILIESPIRVQYESPRPDFPSRTNLRPHIHPPPADGSIQRVSGDFGRRLVIEFLQQQWLVRMNGAGRRALTCLGVPALLPVVGVVGPWDHPYPPLIQVDRNILPKKKVTRISGKSESQSNQPDLGPTCQKVKSR